MGTKNNPKNRAAKVEKKKFDGREIEPVLYYGMNSGHGKYMAAKFVGTIDMIADTSGKPLPWATFA